MDATSDTTSSTGENASLPPFPYVKVVCPECNEEELVLGNGDPECLKCGYTKPAAEAAADFVVKVQGLSLGKHDHDSPLLECPSCGVEGEETMVEMGPGDSAPNPEAFVCFDCGEAWGENEIDRCSDCNRFRELNDVGLCDDCMEGARSRF